MKKTFVAGFPVSHSKSPKLHQYWIDRHGIDATYEAVEIAERDFELFLKALPGSGFSGGNITIPHKEQAFDLVDHQDEAATAIGAVNTVWLESNMLAGSNTDAYGFSANLDDYVDDWRNRFHAVVVGAGGASRAIVYALIKAGYSEISIANRTLERAENLAYVFGPACRGYSLGQLPDLLHSADFLVNTTSLGMTGGDQKQLLNLTLLKQDTIVTDIVYTPLLTPMLERAQELGLKTIDGLGMLLHQAVPGFEKWHGIRPEVTRELRDHILEAP